MVFYIDIKMHKAYNDIIINGLFWGEVKFLTGGKELFGNIFR